MKIVKIPKDATEETIRFLMDKLRQEEHDERILFIRSDIDIIDLSLQDLYKVRDMIDKEISDREMMIPGERNKS